jgi:hypothetical protein
LILAGRPTILFFAVLAAIIATMARYDVIEFDDAPHWAPWAALVAILAAAAIVAAALRSAAFSLFNPLFKPLALSKQIKDSENWSDIYADAANDCDVLAKYHDDKGRYFLVSGMVVAVVGAVYYAFVLFQLSQFETAPVHESLNDIQEALSILGRTEGTRILRHSRSPVFSFRFGSSTPEPEVPFPELPEPPPPPPPPPRLSETGNVNRSAPGQPDPILVRQISALTKQNEVLEQSVSDLKRVNGEMRSTVLSKIDEAVKETTLAVGDFENSRNIKSDILQAFRSATGFLFIEVIAGFLLTLSQRNDAQASFWRSHRQVYDRLLALPKYLRVLSDNGMKSPFSPEWVKSLLTPVPLHVIGGRSANPSLELVKQIAQATRAYSGNGNRESAGETESASRKPKPTQRPAGE